VAFVLANRVGSQTSNGRSFAIPQAVRRRKSVVPRLRLRSKPGVSRQSLLSQS